VWAVGGVRLFANMEHEVDEPKRNAKIAKDGVVYGVLVEVTHGLCVILPRDLVTKVSLPHSYCYCPLLPYSRWSIE